MAILLIIMSLPIGLAWTAGVGRPWWRRAAAERRADEEMIDACARASVLVLVSLFGLLALGMTYGNVLGANAAP